MASGLTAAEFIDKWRAVTLNERSVSQSHFNDLCALLDEPTPVAADPDGEWYCFERGARKDSGGGGWADVWKRGHFAWEYKTQGKDLDAAFQQLRQYALASGKPAAADRLGHAAFPHPHQLDEQRQHGPRVHAVRAGRPGHAQPAEVGLQRARAAAAGADAAGADGAGGGDVCRTGARATGERARPADGGALRQPAGVLHVRRRRGAAAGPDVPADAGPGAAAARAVCRDGPQLCSRP